MESARGIAGLERYCKSSLKIICEFGWFSFASVQMLPFIFVSLVVLNSCVIFNFKHLHF